MISMQRLSLFTKRWLAARQMGFKYKGTTKTPFPTKLQVGGSSIPLQPPIGDECVFDLFNVMLDDEYGLSSLKRAPSVVVDVGVNIGLFVLSAWSRYPEARIFGYEPNAVVLGAAKCNLKATGASLYNEAVGLRAGLCEVSSPEQSRLGKAVPSEHGTIAVRAMSEVLARASGRIDLLKLDCEGAEWDILKDRESLRSVASIRLEYHLDHGRSLSDFLNLVAAGDHEVVNLVEERNHGIAWLENRLMR